MTIKHFRISIFFMSFLFSMTAIANPPPVAPQNLFSNLPSSAHPQITPAAPNVNANGFILIDASSGQVLAAKNPDQRMEPASLTKMMTSYIISAALRAGRFHLDDRVPISETSWRTGGSKMFVKLNDQVPVRDLMQGIIVESGNDACVAMAEFTAGSQEGFVNLMNQQAAFLGMKNTHFMDVNGLPDAGHYTTPRDMATLARALILNFPEDYQWYSQKWFTYNGIRQPNRNRLLWRDPSVDGVKTGHTSTAGYCLVTSALRDNMRLISVVMGAPTDAARANDSEQLLTYGFRFFESRKLYNANTAITQTRVWLGKQKQVPVGVPHDLYALVPAGETNRLKTILKLTPELKAPVQKGQIIGNIDVVYDNKSIATAPLIALQNDMRGHFWQRMLDHVRMWF